MSETPIAGQPPNPTCISLKLHSSNTPKQARQASRKIEVRGEREGGGYGEESYDESWPTICILPLIKSEPKLSPNNTVIL